MEKKSKKIIVMSKSSNLTDEQRMYIFQSYGEGNAFNIILNGLFTKFNLKLRGNDIEKLCNDENNKIYVERFRESYMARFREVPIANKRMRLNDFQEMRNKLFEMVLNLNIKKRADRNEVLMIFRRVNEILCAAREEIEGKPNQQTFFNITELSGLSDEELQKRKEKLIADTFGNINQTDFRIGAVGERDQATDTVESIEVSVAASKEL